MHRIDRIELVGLAPVDADLLASVAAQRGLLREPLRALDARARPRRSVQECFGVVMARAPARPQDEPCPLRERPERLDVRDLQEVVRILGGRLATVDDYDRPDQLFPGDLTDVLAVTPGEPVNRRVEVRPHALRALEPVPVPRLA